MAPAPDGGVDAFTVSAGEGDVFRICSDGLTDMVADEDILRVVEKHRDDLDRATKALVSAANRGGGEDNITVIAFSIAANGDDTVRMEAPVDEDTLGRIPLPTVDPMVVRPEEVEPVFVEPGSAEAAAVARPQPITAAPLIRPVLTILPLPGVPSVPPFRGPVR